MQAIKFFKPLAALSLCTLALSAAAPPWRRKPA